jgi:dolichol-phosphate mannosyltransferase
VAVSLFSRRLEVAREIVDARRKWRFMQVAVAVPLAVFAAVSLRHNVKFDWTAELWLAALPAMAFALTACGEKRSHTLEARICRAWIPTLLGLLLAYAGALHYLVLGLPGLGYTEQMQLMPVGWRAFAQQVSGIAQAVRTATGTEPLVVGMDRYAIASEVAFYASSQTAAAPETSGAHLFGWTSLMYERWVPIESQAGRTLLLVTWTPADLTDKCVEARAERLGPMKTGVLAREGGAVIRHYYYRVAYGYRRYPPCDA